MRRTFATFIVVLCYALPTDAQTLFQGRIDVTVLDAQGAVVPGVLVETSGPASLRQVTDQNGEVHFVNLQPGRYTVTATLSGFNTYQNDQVEVAAGITVPLKVTLGVSGVTEAVQVTSTPLVVDPGRHTITTSVSYDRFSGCRRRAIPGSCSVGSRVISSVNVGGAESGQQSDYLAKGAGIADNTWNLDGIPVTDSAATGSSPTYYNFDMFEELSVTTGGASATNPTPGVQLNMQFKSGANTLAGSGHFFGATRACRARICPTSCSRSPVPPARATA